MEEVNLDSFVIKGLSLTTCNKLEMDPVTAQIPGHVLLVEANVEIDYQAGARAYSVYTNYESDETGTFDVVMGAVDVASASLPLAEIKVAAGRYLKFESEGEFPDAVISAWQSVWSYFSAPNCKHSRAFTTDFEHYESASKVCVYIALR